MPKPWETETDYISAGMRSAQKAKDLRHEAERTGDYGLMFNGLTEQDGHNIRELEKQGQSGRATCHAGEIFVPQRDAESISDTAQNPNPAKK